VSELVWSDPRDDIGDFEASPRVCGWVFGEDAVTRFTEATGFSRLIRAHECCPNGFEWPFGENASVLTLFSSCDYYQSMNDAAIANERGEIKCVRLAPLSRRKAANRCVTLPDWGIEHDIARPREPSDKLVLIEIAV
jgi:hypothetical protein